MNLRRFSRLALLTLVSAAIVQAHPGHDGHELTWDFTAGVLHPLSGWDHLIAMMAVGLWAAMIGGRARWLIPSAFVFTMIAAAIVAPHGVVPTLVEQGIAASILGLGLLIALGARLPLSLGLPLIALFAAFHGWAHGAEMALDSSVVSYGCGFVLSTIALHALGLGLGYSGRHYPKAVRAIGASIAMVGLVAALS